MTPLETLFLDLKDIKVIDSLIEMEEYTLALVKATSILTLDPNNMQALLRKGRISYRTLNNKYDGFELKKAAKLYPNAPEVFIYLYKSKRFLLLVLIFL